MAKFAKLFETGNDSQVLVTILETVIHVVTVIDDVTYTNTTSCPNKRQAQIIFDGYGNLNAFSFREEVENTFKDKPNGNSR